MRLGMVRFVEQGALKVRRRFIEQAPLQEDNAEIAVCLGIVWLEGHSPPVGGCRLLQLPCCPQGVAKVIVRLGIVGFVEQGALEVGSRFVRLALLHEHNAEIAMRFGVVRLVRQRPRIRAPRPAPIELALAARRLGCNVPRRSPA